MVDKKEIEYYLSEYPDLDEEDIVELLEAILTDTEDEERRSNSTNFTDFLNPPKKEKYQGLSKSTLKRIFGK
jgi:hypothetical protein